MPSIFQKIQAKLELYRLEQRYTRNRNRRTTFISNAVYVDGEYVYNTPNSTGSSTSNSSGAWSPTSIEAHDEPQQPTRRRSVEEPRSPTFAPEPQTLAQKKRLNRFSSMPGFGSLAKHNQQDWRTNTVDVREV
ncbi:hypothetical protein BX600DRAFT_508757 [Xylariales sp. PMI_506]|nr:hypothetical protein BX600DRAFT_508757 [Xylariales sp. PMI_506]